MSDQPSSDRTSGLLRRDKQGERPLPACTRSPSICTFPGRLRPLLPIS
jgi:hypothetical protein